VLLWLKTIFTKPIDVASREMWLGVKRHELGYIHGQGTQKECFTPKSLSKQ
jgi:hypothetical protein